MLPYYKVSIVISPINGEGETTTIDAGRTMTPDFNAKPVFHNDDVIGLGEEAYIVPRSLVKRWECTLKFNALLAEDGQAVGVKMKFS